MAGCSPYLYLQQAVQIVGEDPGYFFSTINTIQIKTVVVTSIKWVQNLFWMSSGVLAVAFAFIPDEESKVLYLFKLRHPLELGHTPDFEKKLNIFPNLICIDSMADKNV